METKIERDPLKNPHEGDMWDEGSGINGMTHVVTMVGTKYISYLYDGNKERTVQRETFRRYCKHYCIFGGNRKPAERKRGA